MSLPLNYDGRPIQHPVGGVAHHLNLAGAPWGHASLDANGRYASLCCTDPESYGSYPTRVQVELRTGSEVRCTVYGGPTMEMDLGGPARRLGLIDERGAPWARVEIGDEVRLFDPAGRERARLGMARGLLVLRCWDEWGGELQGQTYFMP